MRQPDWDEDTLHKAVQIAWDGWIRANPEVRPLIERVHDRLVRRLPEWQQLEEADRRREQN